MFWKKVLRESKQVVCWYFACLSKMIAHYAKEKWECFHSSKIQSEQFSSDSYRRWFDLILLFYCSSISNGSPLTQSTVIFPIFILPLERKQWSSFLHYIYIFKQQELKLNNNSDNQKNVWSDLIIIQENTLMTQSLQFTLTSDTWRLLVSDITLTSSSDESGGATLITSSCTVTDHLPYKM